eukprot:g3245.t1
MDFATVSDPSKDLYGISDDGLNWLYSSALLGVCLAMIPYAYSVEKYNYLSYAFGIVCVVAGAWIRYISAINESYACAVVSSVLLGIGNAVALVLYGPIPFTFFPPAQRSLALSVAVQSNYAGWCLGSFLIPRLIEHKEDFSDFLFVQAIVVSFNCVFFLVFYREKPVSGDDYVVAGVSRSATGLDNADVSCEALFRYDDEEGNKFDANNSIVVGAATAFPIIPTKPATMTRPASGPVVDRRRGDRSHLLSDTEPKNEWSSIAFGLLSNRQFLLHTFCVTLLGGASFTISAVVDLVVTDDDRFTDTDAAWMNSAYILAGVISGVLLGVVVKRMPERVGCILRGLFLLSASTLTVVAVIAYVNKHVDRIDFNTLFVVNVFMFALIGIAALGFCGLSLSLAIRAGTETKGVSESLATTIPELGLNAFGAITTQASNADTGFMICAGMSWLVVVAMWLFYVPLKCAPGRPAGGVH